MRKIISTSTLIAAILIAGLTVLTPVTASAREGAQSVGKGIKCYTAAVMQTNGTLKYQRVCYKSI
jgi:hypothetical protein